MKRILLAILIASILALLTACDKNNKNTQYTPINQRILFQVEYINYAWIYQHNGYLIDCSGNIYSFNNPENWNFIEDNGTISEVAMNENLLSTDSIIYTLDDANLENKQYKINHAVKGNISDLKCEMVDAGTIVYSTFTLNKRTHKYKQVILNQWGDCSRENSSAAAKDLYEWLRYVEENYLLNN
ncbi:hypothetical protein [Carboxylicivirga linearis]|uniref:Lipoprotein n=1 Tax=Carboxylicivirga linearis TaxID=1628157 RepID=A0ABS5JRS9_9BACT|nr:hypothetical protein [Carboxylicivirga linearis]MBS2097593.1 hypothetical protein [Carboxylicivirga linearis]